MHIELLNVPVNLLAVILAAVVYFILGMFWYSQMLFGNQWMKLVGLDPKKAKEYQTNMGKEIFVMVIAALVMSLIFGLILPAIALLLTSVTSSALLISLISAVLLWLGFIASTQLPNLMFAQKDIKQFVIDGGYSLVGLLLMAVVFTLLV